MSAAENADVNLLKMDMKITAKRMKLKDKNTNLEQVSSKIPIGVKKSETFTIPKHSASHRVNQENFPSKKDNLRKPASQRKKKTFVRRPVDYTWNRGGRLKEIRIRTQARKFLYLWINRAFGKMTFSQASSYHKKALIRKSFLEWKGIWWEKCGEMKLWIRAEYFDRYRTYGKVWLAWKEFTQYKKQQKAKNEIALKHYSSLAYRQYISLWKVYVQLRRVKKNLYNKAYSIAKTSATKQAWIKWQSALSTKRKEDENMGIASCHWSNVIQMKTWNVWLTRYNERCVLHRNNSDATKHHNMVIVKRSLQSWFQYIAIKQRKYNLYKKAQHLYELSLKHRVITHWWSRYEQLLLHQKRIAVCETMSVRCTKRKYFLKWLEFVELVNLERRKQAIADIHYRKQLLRKSIFCLKYGVFLHRKKMESLYKAIHFYANSLLVRCWTRWQQRMETIEEKDLSQLTSLARKHHRFVMLKNTFAAIRKYKIQKVEEKKNIIKAEAHFIVKAQPKCFHQWQSYVKEVKGINQIKRDADSFRREVLSSKYFYLWWTRFEHEQETRTMERMALIQHNENTLRHHFCMWKGKTQIILSANRSDAIARVHYRKVLLRSAVRSWVAYTKAALARHKKFEYAALYHQNSVVAGAWLSWRQYTDGKREIKQKVEKSVHHHNQQLLTKCMKYWKCYCEISKAKAERCEAGFAVKQRIKLCEVFQTWRRRTKDWAVKRRSNEMAQRHHRHNIQRSIVKSWKEWAAVHYHKKQQTIEGINEARSVLDRSKLKLLFQRWKQQKDITVSDRHNFTRACLHYNNKVNRILFQAWRVYRYICLKKDLMKRQAANYNDSRILKTYFFKWRVMLEFRYEQESKTGEALWHWAITLQSKCFLEWRFYVSEKKRKKVRYDRAMDARRCHLLRQGCSQILRYHGDQLARRTSLAACQQAQTRYVAYHLAWKYGKLWIEKVRRRTGQPNFSSRITPFREPEWAPITTCAVKDSSKIWISRPAPITAPPVPVPSQKEPMRKISPTHRPEPRHPEFLDESLGREGLIVGERAPFTEHFERAEEESCSSSEFCQSLPLQTSADFFHTSPSCHRSPTSAVTSRTPYGIPVTSYFNFRPSPEAPSLPDRTSQNTYKGNTSNLVLLPPSAFRLSEDNEPSSTDVDNHGDVVHLNGDWRKQHENPRDDEDKSLRDLGGGGDTKKATFKTFIASPKRGDKDELKLIYENLQEFQKKKHQLKKLRQQREVLERWIDDNLSSALNPNASLDMVAVQEELDQIKQEAECISKELLQRKPEVESLALRVRVLCSRPT
ncbi:unnamed protein product [Clavelina lepadiformis]|uniref:Protein SFI1 homolog n=1 Tax=Clavelina lepadiformis TaxID=159417 RepID=A0ABP0F7Y9_CLALP